MKSFLIALFLSLGIMALSQDNCSYELTGKILKLYDQSKDSKKYEADERMAFLDKALEEDPNCLPCLRRKGELLFLRAKRSGASFAEAERVLENLVELCPEYHSEPYYFLGAMFYADKQYEKAELYLDKFIKFPSDDATKFERDYDEKYNESKEAIEHVRVYAEIYKGQIAYNPVKVGGVSSNVDDYLPLLSPDGQIMFYTRKLYKQAKGDYEQRLIEEFCWSQRPDINAAFDSGEPLPPPFNVGDSYGGATVSVDNRELIIAKKNPDPKNPQNIDLFFTRYSKSTDAAGHTVYSWSTLESLGPNINTVDGWEAQPSLSGDGKFLIFAAVRPECMKDPNGNLSHDLFISERRSDGTWSPAKPLPAPINTKGQEKAPFMHSDSRTLYFASTGQLGVGGFDLFYSKMNDDGTFSTPKNIGFPINDEKDQLGIVVSSDGEWAYFGANKLNGEKGWDIYAFKMPVKAKPDKVVLVKGNVKTDAGEPAQNAEVEIKYAQSGASEKVKVNNDDGSYAAIVKIEKKEDVLLSVQGEGIAFNSRIIAKKEDTAPPVVVKLNMEAPPADENATVVINDIVYTTNRAEIMEESKLILDELATYLTQHPSIEIEIMGHTDNVGNDQANLALSMDRAFEVLKYLTSKGVDGSRLSAKGYGETKPIADNNTEDGRAQNRRTEFRIKKI